jgi:hypothetical protein
MATHAIPFEKVTVIEVVRVENQTLVRFSDGKITILDTDDPRPPPHTFASNSTMKGPNGITIIGSRTTDDGLVVRFSDGEFYLFRSTFIIDNRTDHADRVRPGQWLTDNWKRQSSKNQESS